MSNAAQTVLLNIPGRRELRSSTRFSFSFQFPSDARSLFQVALRFSFHTLFISDGSCEKQIQVERRSELISDQPAEVFTLPAESDEWRLSWLTNTTSVFRSTADDDGDDVDDDDDEARRTLQALWPSHSLLPWLLFWKSTLTLAVLSVRERADGSPGGGGVSGPRSGHRVPEQTREAKEEHLGPQQARCSAGRVQEKNRRIRGLWVWILSRTRARDHPVWTIVTSGLHRWCLIMFMLVFWFFLLLHFKIKVSPRRNSKALTLK